MKISTLCAAVTASFGVLASGAIAAPVSSAITPGVVQFSDNSAEQLIDRGVQNGLLDVGDSLRGIFSIDNITGGGGPVAIGTGTGFNELTGLFQVVVLTKTATSNPALFNYTFGFDATFGQGAGVVAVLRDDPAQNFRRANCLPTNTVADCEASATGGSIWATLGFGGQTFWSAANAAENPGIGAILPLATPLGTFGLGLNFIANNTGFAWNKVNCVDTTNFSIHSVDVCGQGGILASGRSVGGSNSPYDIFDNVDFTANAVPEPGTMALAGLALLGMGLAGRRRKQA